MTRPLSTHLIAALTTALVAGALTQGVAAAAEGTVSSYSQIAGKTGWNAGTHDGTRVLYGRLTTGTTRPVTIGTATFQTGSWTSAWQTSSAAFTELVPSWRATTPAGTYLSIELRVRDNAGRTSSFDTLATWANGTSTIKRASGAAQRDDLARVAADTLSTTGSMTQWQARIRFFKRAKSARPTLAALGMLASTPGAVPATSTPSALAGRKLGVPAYSQMVHRAHGQAYGGGAAWCSPTSLAMVLAYYAALPGPSAWAWVPKTDPAPWVDNTAKMTYDYAYKGTGNWSFNTAYAAQRLPVAYVTRMSDLTDVEAYIANGIPVIASISFAKGQLAGSPLTSTPGHLLVIVGTTAGGDVIVNDPAAPRDTSVRRTYKRAEFERAWLGRSHGTVYVLADSAHPLPHRAR